MHKSTRAQLKSVETSRPDETTFRGVAFGLSEGIVDGTIRDLMIAIDIVGGYRIDFTPTRNGYAGVDQALHASHARSIFE